MSEFQAILGLIDEVVPSTHDDSLDEVIKLNQFKMQESMGSVLHAADLFKSKSLEGLLMNALDQSKTADENKQRIKLLKFMVAFRSKVHVEMLDFAVFREILTIDAFKILFRRQSFVNFTIQEKQMNQLLNIQGYFLKNFIYFHMRHDMRFKATIDSTVIDIDNPYTRQTIRNENRADAFLNPKYIQQLDIENFCMDLLDKFFPDIAGIWADHTHNAPYYILEFIKIAFELGFFTVANAFQILEKLKKITTNLIKLEEGWVDKLNEVNRFSDMIKASNITNLFAKCRENMAYLLVQIIVLISDQAFIERYPHYVKERHRKSEHAKKKGKKYEWAEFEKDIRDDFNKGFCFNDKEVNDSILFITMNYLSNTVYLSFQKSMNHDSREAVEKIFLYITSQNRDTFLNSLKQIKIEDLAFFEEEDIVSKEVRETCDELGYSMRKLLELIGQGQFDVITGALNKNLVRNEDFEKHLKEYVPSDNPTLPSIIKRLLLKIDEGMRKDEHFKVALAKESIPLQLISMVDYISEHFSHVKSEPASKRDVLHRHDVLLMYADRPGANKGILNINKEILSKLNTICAGNNYAKSQLFKGEALFHLKRLMHRFDKDVFLFLNNLCLEDNIAFYLGKEIFLEFLSLYERFNSSICKDLNIQSHGHGHHKSQHEILNIESPADNLNVEKGTTLLLMTKIITKLFKKQFLNDREKIQYALMVQESIHQSLCILYLPSLLVLLKDPSLQSLSSDTDINFTKAIFKDNSESELINILEKKQLSRDNHKILFLQICFNVLRMFNIVSSDCFSNIIKKDLEMFVEPVKQYMSIGNIRGKRWAEPFGLDAELINFIRIFGVMPEQHCMMETQTNMSTTNKDSFTGYMSFVSDCIERVVDYDSNSNLKMEAQIYLFEGIFPLIFKIVNSVKDLTNFDRPQMVQSNLEMVKDLISKLNPQIKHFNNIATDDGKEVVPEGYLTVNKEMHKEKATRRPSLSGSQVFKDAKQKSSDSATSRQTLLINICEHIISFLEKYFEKAEEEHQERFKNEKDIDHDKFINMELAAKFEDKPSDPKELRRKKGILNSYIKLYYQAKEEYFTRPAEPNLMSYFDRNNQNLRGVFNSCLDRLLNRKKVERFGSKGKSIVEDYAITKFWFNPACYAYINMLTRLLTQSKSARKEFYNFVQEDRKAEAALKNPAISKQEKEQNHKNLEDIKKVTGSRNRDHIFGILLRIHTDLLLYLNSNASLKPLWWVTHQTYEMISMFFKNLCECNFMPFKEYLGEITPETEDLGWQEFKGLSVAEVFVRQLTYLCNINKISKNKEPSMTHTDQIDKMHALMVPLVNLINETITGPCMKNQRILMGWPTDNESNSGPAVPNPAKQNSFTKALHLSPIDGLINISMRVVDELDSVYSELASSSITLLISMTEGYGPEILRSLATKIPSSILVDRLTRFTKKIYIKELIQAGKFEKLAIQKLSLEMETEKLLDADTNATNSGKPVENVVTPEARVKAEMENQNLEEQLFIISEDMESMVEIQSWEELFNIYMKRPEFSESKEFQYIFMLMILWRALAKFNKSHESRLEDARYESEEVFKEKNLNLNIFAKDDEKKKIKPAEFASIFYFVSNKIMVEIEVVDPTGLPLKIYFPKAPPCYMLSDEARKSYREECAITDSNTKMLDLMRNYKLFEILMTYELKTWRAVGFGFKFLSADALNRYTFCCWLLGVILNFVLAASVVMDPYGEYLIYRDNSYKVALKTVGYILVAVSALFLVVWFLFKYKQTYLTRKEDYLFDNPSLDGSSWKVKLYVMIFPAYLSQPFPVNYTLHILFTVIGMEVAFIAISLNLLLIVNISKTAKFVLTSILLHVDQLILTLILAFFIIFAYSVLLGNNLSDHLASSSTACNTLVNCFFYTVNLGLRNGGGIVDSMTTTDRDKMMAERTVFDITFFMLINVISLNIIFGIIIDTFSQLRDAQNERSKPFLNSYRHQEQLLCLRQYAHRLQQAGDQLRRSH